MQNSPQIEKTSFDVQVVEMDLVQKQAAKSNVKKKSERRWNGFGVWLRTAAGHELLEDREQLPVLCHGCVGLRRVRNHRAARLIHLAKPPHAKRSDLLQPRKTTRNSSIENICTKCPLVLRRSFEKTTKTKSQNMCTKPPKNCENENANRPHYHGLENHLDRKSISERMGSGAHHSDLWE